MFNTAVVDDHSLVVLNPKLSQDVQMNSSLSFVLPTCNVVYSSVKKMKSIVTLERDGEVIFRGRVMDEECDIYNQKTLYCEEDKGFLNDTLHAPYTYSGTVQGLFSKLITNHNGRVSSDVEKQFTVGNVTAVSSSKTVEVESEEYATTYDEIEDRLLNVYGGYLRTRTVGNTHYIDWLDQPTDSDTKEIKLSVNLLDLRNASEGGDVFTVLIPLGFSEINEDGEYTDPLTVASVNGGLDYIVDTNAAAKYGWIWRTHSWPYEEDAQKLLEKGREYLKTGTALETLVVKAVDMCYIGTAQHINVGDRVHVISDCHGLEGSRMCTAIELDIMNPENTMYTFGERPRTLTENYIKTEAGVNELNGGYGGGRRSVQEEIGDIIRWAKINVDEANAAIELTAGELNQTAQQLNAVALRMDGAEANIELAASSLNDIEGSLTSVGIKLDGIGGAITSRVEKNGVISAINQTAEQITISASKINLSGYVTSSTLSAELVSMQNAFAESFGTFDLSATNIGCYSLTVDGSSAQWCTSPDFVKSVSLKGTSSFSVKDTNGIVHTIYAGYSISTDKDSISYLGDM